MILFTDTSAFIALEDKDDQYHQPAKRFQQEIQTKRYRLITSYPVLIETLTLLRSRLGHQRAVTFGNLIQSSRVIEILRITPQIGQEAWNIFVKYNDKDFSYIDCISFAIMQHLKIGAAFTFDHHFEQFGLTKLP